MNRTIENVLIVDDDKDDGLWLAEVMRDFLATCKCHLERDGIAALRYIKNNPAPDVVFLDLNMPLKNGLECLRDIQNNNLLPGTPIIIYSTSNNLKDIDLAYKYNAMCYIVKPTSTKQLKLFVNHVLTVISITNGEKVDKSDFVLMENLLNSQRNIPF
jgi:CheY-like chemotaxis protein